MEVHHHPHVEKKGFKEYFLEFIMIFLAVTLGFIAENIREEITDHSRAKIYGEAMVDDLKADTAELNSYYKYWEYASKNVDTLFQLLEVNDPDEVPSGKLYWYGLFGGASEIFIPNDATFQQMKSAGALRLFNNDLMHKVAKYDQLNRTIKTYEQQDEGTYQEVRKIRSQIFYFKINKTANDIYQAGRTATVQNRIDSFMHSNPPLLRNDKAIFNQYLELVRSRFISSKVISAKILLQQATTLIEDLKKEYRL
jgi:hypothetical protein